MSQSLSEECTPLKKEYDSCFNSWFEGYLEPAVAAASTPEKRAEHSKKKAEEFEAKCGKIWRQYKTCVTVCVSMLFCGIYLILMRAALLHSKLSKTRDWTSYWNKRGKRILSSIPYLRLPAPIRKTKLFCPLCASGLG